MLAAGDALLALPAVDLPAKTITVVRREAAAHTGRLIAANAHFICYALRGGLIRVIHRKSEALTLLRGHTQEIADLKFLGTDAEAAEDLLGSIADNGHAFVWRLSSCLPDDATISTELLLSVSGEQAASGGRSRIALCSRTASAPDQLVYAAISFDEAIVSLHSVGGAAGDEPLSISPWMDQGERTAAIDFSEEGDTLACGSNKGVVTLLPVGTSSTAPIGVIAAHESAVSLLAHCGKRNAALRGLLITAAAANGEFKLWRVPTGSQACYPTCLQKFLLPEPASPLPSLPTHAVFEPASQLLLTAGPAPSGAADEGFTQVFAFQLADTTAKEPCFERASRFSFKGTVLSADAIPGTAAAGDSNGDEGSAPRAGVELLCVQTTGVECFTLPTTQQVSSSDVTAAVSGASAEPAELHAVDDVPPSTCAAVQGPSRAAVAAASGDDARSGTRVASVPPAAERGPSEMQELEEQLKQLQQLASAPTFIDGPPPLPPPPPPPPPGVQPLPPPEAQLLPPLGVPHPPQEAKPVTETPPVSAAAGPLEVPDSTSTGPPPASSFAGLQNTVRSISQQMTAQQGQFTSLLDNQKHLMHLATMQQRQLQQQQAMHAGQLEQLRLALMTSTQQQQRLQQMLSALQKQMQQPLRDGAAAADVSASVRAALAEQREQLRADEATAEAVRRQELNQRLSSLDTGIAQQMHTVLLPSMRTAISESAAESSAAVQALLNEQLQVRQQLLNPLQEAVSSSLRQFQEGALELPTVLAANMQTTLTPVVVDAFKSSFSGTLLPGFERASQRMFEQLHAGFTRGMESFSSEVSTVISAGVDKMEESQTQLLSTAQARIESIAGETTRAIRKAVEASSNRASDPVARAPTDERDGQRAAAGSIARPSAAVGDSVRAPPPLPTAIGRSTSSSSYSAAAPAASLFAPSVASLFASVPASGPQPPIAPPLPPGEPKMRPAAAFASAPAPSAPAESPQLLQHFSLTMELQKLLAAGKAEQAFATALGAQSLDLVVWLCKKLVSPRELISQCTNQIILVSLVQQLAYDLRTDTDIKLTWLSEVILKLVPHPSDAKMRQNAHRILLQVGTNLRSVAEVFGHTGSEHYVSYRSVALNVTQMLSLYTQA